MHPYPEKEEEASDMIRAFVEQLGSIGCACKPWQQSWKAETPGVCTTCGLPFVPYSSARETCDKTSRCLLLPGHDGKCM